MKVSMMQAGALALVLGTAWGLQACTKGTQEIPPPDPVPTLARPVAVTITDGATNLPVESAVLLTVRDQAGNPSRVTQTRDGASSSSFTTVRGMAIFQVAASAALPQTLVVVATSDGFASTSLTFTVSSEGGVETSASMIKIQAPPTGVTATQETAGTTSSGGTTSATVTVATNPEPVSGGATAVTVPAQTTITAKDGAPLQGELTATVTYNNATDSTSLSTFPNGMNVEIPGAGSGSFLTIGFATVEIRDQNGTPAASFSQPIDLIQDLPVGTVNPTTGRLLVAGDAIPFWSFDKQTAAWTREPADAVVRSGGNTGLQAVGKITHLSVFNLGWFAARSACAYSTYLNVTGNRNPPVPISYEISSQGYQADVASDVTDSRIDLTEFPSGVAATIKATYLGQVVGNLDVADLCAPSFDFRLSLPAEASATLDVTFLVACSNATDKTNAVPQASVSVTGVPATGGLPKVLGSALTDGAGKATIANLPPNISLTVNGSIGAGYPVPSPQTVTIAPGRTGAITLTAYQACGQSGAQ